jgi:hypothetical protein
VEVTTPEILPASLAGVGCSLPVTTHRGFWDPRLNRHGQKDVTWLNCLKPMY